MKKILLTMMIAVATSAMSFAQDNNRQMRQRPSKTEMVKMRTDRTVEQLGLDKKQAKKLLELNTAYADKMPMQFGRHGGHRGRGPQADSTRQQRPSREQMEARMKEMKANHEAYNAELKKILTEQQFAQYEQAQKERMQHFGQRRDGKKPQSRHNNF